MALFPGSSSSQTWLLFSRWVLSPSEPQQEEPGHVHFRAVPGRTQRLLQGRVCRLRASSVGGPHEGSWLEGVGEQAVSCVTLNSHQHTRWAGPAQFPEQPSEAWAVRLGVTCMGVGRLGAFAWEA